MDILKHLKNDFYQRDLSKFKQFKKINKLIYAEKTFFNSLTKKQQVYYNKLKSLDDKNDLLETNEALEFGFHYALDIIKTILLNK